jgi:hypothetical protein
MIHILFVYVLRLLFFCALRMTHNLKLLVRLLNCAINFTNMYSKTLSEQAQRFPGGWGSLISRQSAHEGSKVASPMHRPPLLTAVRGWFDPRTIVRPEGLCPSGIEPASFQLLAQSLTECLPIQNVHDLKLSTYEFRFRRTPIINKSSGLKYVKYTSL